MPVAGKGNDSLLCVICIVIDISILVLFGLPYNQYLTWIPVIPHARDDHNKSELVQLQGVAQARNFIELPIAYVSRRVLHDTIGRRVSAVTQLAKLGKRMSATFGGVYRTLAVGVKSQFDYG